MINDMIGHDSWYVMLYFALLLLFKYEYKPSYDHMCSPLFAYHMFLTEKTTQVKCNGKKWKDLWEEGTPGIYQLKGESITSVAKTAMVNEPDVDLESADKIFGKMQTIIMAAATGRSTQPLPLPSTGENDDGADMASFWQSFGSGGMPVAAPKKVVKPKSGTKRTRNNEPDNGQKQARVSALVHMAPDSGNPEVKEESGGSGGLDADSKWLHEFGESLKGVLSIKLKYEIPKDDAEQSFSKSALSSAQKLLSSMLNQAWVFPEHIHDFYNFYMTMK